MNDRSKRRAGVLNRWKRWWEWWTRVEAPDEETARVGWVFSILMLISIGIVSAIAGVFILEWVLGIMPLQIAVIAIVFPVFFIPFSVFCWWIARRGRIRQAVTLYVWANFVGIALAIFVFDGLTSSAWILYIWTVTIAGTLIAPGYALGMVGLVVGYYLLLSVLQAIGWYQPPLGLSIYGGLFSYVAFTLIILVSTVGGGTYLNTRSLQEALGRLRAATRELEEHRRTLEQRVAQRTADLARRTAQLEAASTVARRAAEIRDLNILLDETVRLISERFGFYHVGIFLLDEAGEYAVLRAASSESGRRMVARGHRLAVGEMGIVGYVAGTGKPRIALDVGADAVFFSNPELPHTRSEMALPLKVGERVIGVLDVQSVEPAAFTDEDVAVLQTMADQIALAIENARLLSEVQDRLREVEALSREYTRREWRRMVSERPFWGYVYDGIEVRPKEQAPLSEGTSPSLTIPLQLTTGETIGRVALALPDRPLTEEEVELARAVAQQAALALESARLFQETRQTLAEMDALYRASRAISTASTPDEVLRAFVDHVVPPQIDRCLLALLDPNSPLDEIAVNLVAAWDRGKERSPALGYRWSASQIPLIAQHLTEPVVIPNVATHPDLDEASRHMFLNVLGIQAMLGVPLMAGERLLGRLILESLTGPYEFTDREIRLYRTLADQAAVALERMRLFEETRRRAEWERTRAEIASRVRASTDIETILRTAVRELGRAFRAAEGVIQLHGSDRRGS